MRHTQKTMRRSAAHKQYPNPYKTKTYEIHPPPAMSYKRSRSEKHPRPPNPETRNKATRPGEVFFTGPRLVSISNCLLNSD